MLSLTPEEIQSWKESFAKDGIVYKTDDEYLEAASNLVEFIDLLIEIDKNRKERPASENDDAGTYFLDNNGGKILY